MDFGDLATLPDLLGPAGDITLMLQNPGVKKA